MIEALQAAKEEENSQTCGELAEGFQVSNEAVRHYLHRISKA